MSYLSYAKLIKYKASNTNIKYLIWKLTRFFATNMPALQQTYAISLSFKVHKINKKTRA